MSGVLRLEEPIQFFTEAWEEARDSLTVTSIYNSDPEPPEMSDVMTTLAKGELTAWSEQLDATGDMNSLAVARLDLGIVLGILGSAGDDAAIEHVPRLLRVEPQLTRPISHYLFRLSEVDSAATDSAVIAALEESALTSWQKVWLLYSISNPERPVDPWTSSSLNPSLGSWGMTQAASSNEFVSSSGIWALAVNKSLPVELWSDFAERCGEYGSPFATAAISGVTGAHEAQALVGASALDQLIHQWAEAHVRS